MHADHKYNSYVVYIYSFKHFCVCCHNFMEKMKSSLKKRLLVIKEHIIPPFVLNIMNQETNFVVWEVGNFCVIFISLFFLYPNYSRVL